jgi:GTP-binding protein
MLKVILIGRANVGKSTFFNAVNSTRCRAIVYDLPGVTRDCNYSQAVIGSTQCVVIDTPGIVLAKVGLALQGAIKDSDLIAMIVDGKIGIVPDDIDLAQFVRNASKKVILLVNKCENSIVLGKEYYRLGFGDPICISAAHKIGFDKIGERIKEIFSTCEFESLPKESDGVLEIAIVGRPNTGKSTLINALLGKERLEVSDVAGTTRDSIAVQLTHKGDHIRLLDTAGMRRKTRIFDTIEKYSTSSSIESIKKAKVVVLILEANEPLQRQDVNILHLAKAHKKALVIAVNKTDLVRDIKKIKGDLEHEINRIVSANIVYFSALRQNNIDAILDACIDTEKLLNRVIPTSKLNAWLKVALKQKSPGRNCFGRVLKIKYCVCIKQHPMTVRLFCNLKEGIDEQYTSYLSNSFRKHFSFVGLPIEFICSSTPNPYARSS